MGAVGYRKLYYDKREETRPEQNRIELFSIPTTNDQFSFEKLLDGDIAGLVHANISHMPIT